MPQRTRSELVRLHHLGGAPTSPRTVVVGVSYYPFAKQVPELYGHGGSKVD